MRDTTQQSAAGGIVQSYIHTTEIVERPAADRPLRDTVDAIADWLLGPALQVATGAQAVDEFAWRMLAAGFPLARLTVHSGMLHPQFLGTSLIWWRDTGQTVQTFIEHEVVNVVAYHDNPVLRVIQGGETLRRRIDVADSELDLPILHDLKAKGCTDYLALPIAGAHGGEILKFIGDGLLAIFPVDSPPLVSDAANNAMAAAMQGLEVVHRLVDDPSMLGEPVLRIVVALHRGNVIYGNVGAYDRLDFTVIGPAVNLVSRLETVGKSLDLPIIVSDGFARAYGRPLASLGQHELRGLAGTHELFAPISGRVSSQP